VEVLTEFTTSIPEGRSARAREGSRKGMEMDKRWEESKPGERES